MRLSLSVNTCFAVKRWPSPGEWMDVVRDRLGLRVVQHSLDLVEPPLDDASIDSLSSAIRVASRASGVTVESTFTGLAAYSSNMLLHPQPQARASARLMMRRAIDFTARIGAVATGGHVGACSVHDWNDQRVRAERWIDLKASLATLAADAWHAGLDCLVVENLAAAREPSTMAMVRDLLTNGDSARVPIRLCLDVGHMCVPGTSGNDRDPYAWLRELGSSAPMIQLQQTDAEGDNHWPFTAARNAMGRIDADRLINALEDGGVDESTLILEVIPPFEQRDDDVLDDMRASVDYWRDALSRRGVAADA